MVSGAGCQTVTRSRLHRREVAQPSVLAIYATVRFSIATLPRMDVGLFALLSQGRPWGD